MNSADLVDFNHTDLKHRLLHGGIPPFFLAPKIAEHDFQEWIDSYWAKDIQELFRLERRYSFQKFLELIFVQSSGMFEASRFASPCEVSRGTISNYLNVLEATFVAHVIRPYSSHRSTEIISSPKVYAFDTGFVCSYKGWNKIRQEDLGFLWEHYVLNELHSFIQKGRIHYWRDKRQHEIDFVLPEKSKPPIAIECKWKANGFESNNLAAFRKQHPGGENYVVASDIIKSYRRQYDTLSIRFVSLEGLIEAIMRPDSHHKRQVGASK